MYFYKNTYPDIDDIIMVKIIKVDDMGAECILLEYNNKTAYLPINEFSRRRIKSARQVLRVNNILPLQVIFVDKIKGFIDVSKKHVTATDISLCTNKYKSINRSYNIINRVSEILSEQNEEKNKDDYFDYLQNNLIWPFLNGRYDLYQHFKEVVRDDKPLFNENSLDPTITTILLSILKNRIKIIEKKIISTVVITNYGPEGVDSVKKCLMAGNIEGVNITVKKCPEYEIMVVCVNKTKGEELMERSLKLIENKCSMHINTVFHMKII